MIAELSIKNFAIIEAVSISFDKGLTVLTGETGAGKSIIIDAIHLLAGGRGSQEFVRHGEKRAEIEGLFLIESEKHPCIHVCHELGIELDDNMVVLRREIHASGKSVCRVNGKLVTISVLREVGRTLVDIHGQHEHQELMNADLHIDLLDQFGNETINKCVEAYNNVYDHYKSLEVRLNDLTTNEQQMAHRLDLIQFQLEEINNAKLQPKEEEELLAERNKISNYQKLFQALNNSYYSLHGEQKGLDWVGHAMSETEALKAIDPKLGTIYETISNAYYQLEEASYHIRDEIDQLEYDPERLDFIEGRLSEIKQLKKKYGSTVEEILEYAAKIEEELETIQNKDSHIHKLQQELESVESDLLLEAKALTEARTKAAVTLEEKIHEQLRDLYLEKANFKVNVTSHNKFQKNGVDAVEFYLTTNPGEPLKPLARVASGGELSRIMLAMKSIFSQHQGITSIIFDEVDTGVSGKVAQAIANKIYSVSVESQVLCISHLPQVAAMSDTHLFISKEIDKDRTKTRVNILSTEEKVNEIGRMISGIEVTELTKKHAKELLQLANRQKEIK
ncbi:DNA repair protein RecN [Sutcliffiella cohnii]|uniref:DNA repair protein RecN n=1 Tax=Sutcliffiella cohnii TaxID=33932 RepID=A0A223KSJ3_9BACI|nr:DNA repair protein RecN [Sutcliffiella cohnii]AST92439.1 DNA repair protein RecN [Sutcliffiella cohnii]MED4017089.1 DNA repair protein RecN [Sutcliffiella cohnii]